MEHSLFPCGEGLLNPLIWTTTANVRVCMCVRVRVCVCLCVCLCRQLNKMMAQLELMKALFERAGGAKHGADIAPTARRKRSSASVSDPPLALVVVCCCLLLLLLFTLLTVLSPQDSDYDSLTFKLTDCADAVTGLETIVCETSM